MPVEEPEAESEVLEEEPTSAEREALNEKAAKGTSEASDSKVEKGSVDLLPGTALTAREAFRITSATRTQLLLIAGPVASGKTTLITSIFHCFQRGPFAHYLFAGSDTLLGFDERSHLARTTSGRTAAETGRTIPGTEHTFLHLKVCADDRSTPVKHLLIADLSGEHFDDAADSVDGCRRLSIIRRADHFILLVDGGKLVKHDQRQSAKSRTLMLLRCCLDAGQLDQRSLVDVLFSKWDIVDNSENKLEDIAFIEQVEASIKHQFTSRVGRLRFFRVAARPAKGDFLLGHGLTAPFSSWVEDTPAEILPTNMALDEPKDISELDRYLKRVLPQLFKGAY